MRHTILPNARQCSPDSTVGRPLRQRQVVGKEVKVPELLVKITLMTVTKELLVTALQQAYAVGNLRVVKRASVLLAVAKEEAISTIAETWNISRQTVYNWLVAFGVSGVDSLQYRKSSGRPPKLTKTQRARLKEVVQAGPQAAGFETACWTTLLIQQVIYREFGVLYSRQYLCDLLESLGFSYQKAKFVSAHLDEKRRRRWMQKRWPKILRQAKKRRAWLLFGDEASFPQWGSLSYTWALKGQQPLVKTSGKRKGYKVFGAIDFFTGRLFYQAITDRFDSATYQTFLLDLLAQTSQHIILIQDGAKYHTSQATRLFFARHRDRLTVYQLPSYSPDYNPIEYLWKNTKKRATHNKYFPTFESMTLSVDKALAYYANHPEEVKPLMGVYCHAMTTGTPLTA
jgi:transposase